MRQLSTFTFDNVGEKTLLTVDDFANVPFNDVKNFSPPAQSANNYSTLMNQHVTQGDDICSFGTETEKIVLLDTNYLEFAYGKVTAKNGADLYGVAIYDKVLGQVVQDAGWNSIHTPVGKIRIGVILDDDEERGYLLWQFYSNNYGWRLWLFGGLSNGTDIIYNSFIEQPTYTWQSVPSISGKNGILTLSTLNDVNDGEPVETSDTSKFNLTDGSNVSALVTARLSE